MQVEQFVNQAKNLVTDFPVVHVFSTRGMKSDGEVTVGFYDAASDQITTVKLSGGSASIEPPAESFKKEDTIASLVLSDVKLDLDEALAVADDFAASQYPSQLVDKQITLLQTIDGAATYNFTFVTKQFSVLNIRVDAASGKVTSHKAESIFSFKAE